MIIDGVKWACDACIRGHRVSGCTHNDRELKQIAKKGRPVSQCPHCRNLRKSRSAHVKCDCGERHGKDAKKANNATCCTADKTEKTGPAQCTCCHGGKCKCALKKDPSSLHTVPEFTPELKRSSTTPTDVRRPRIQSTQSESSLTTFANGHHRPTHRTHHGHSVSPYTIAGHADHPRTSFLDDEDRPVSIHKRRVKSDVSPSDILAISRLHNSGLMALELNSMELTPRQVAPRQQPPRLSHGLSVNTSQAQFNMHESYNTDFLQSADCDPQQFSAGLHPSAGWPVPQFDLEWYYPTLTSSSSGDDIDEHFNQATASTSLTGTGSLPSEASDLGDDYRLSTSSSFIGIPTPSILSTERSSYDMDRYLLDYLPMEAAKQFHLDRYLSDPIPQSGFMDNGLNLTMAGESGYDVDSPIFNTYLTPHQEINDSSEALDLLTSSMHSPADSNLLLGMSTPNGEEDGMVWMRKFSNASTYHSTLDASWTSQCQSPR